MPAKGGRVSTPRTLSIAEAARHAEVPVSTFRRRMYALNELAEGKLLVPAGRRTAKRVGKWLVVVAVLDEVAPARSKSRAATKGELEAVKDDVTDAHRRIDVLDIRTEGQSSRLRKHDRELRKHRLALDFLRKAQDVLLGDGPDFAEAE